MTADHMREMRTAPRIPQEGPVMHSGRQATGGAARFLILLASPFLIYGAILLWYAVKR